MIQKGNRGIAVTIKELMESQRLRIAVQQFENDPLFLKAILTELALEIFSATKSSITKIVAKAYGKGWEDKDGIMRGVGLDAFELVPYLRSLDVDSVNNLNLFWGLSPQEIELYKADPKGKMTPEQRKELLERVKAKFGMD